MLWAILIALFIATLSGGPEEIFMIPKLDKEIKSHIEDKDRKNEILLVAKEAKKEIKEFGKLKKKNLKQLKKQSRSRDTSTQQLLDLYQTYFNARLSKQSIVIEHRLKIHELLNENEWELIIKPAILPSEKERSEMILKELEVFTATLKEDINEGQKMNFEDNKLFKDKNALMKDLQDFYNRHNERHIGIFHIAGDRI